MVQDLGFRVLGVSVILTFWMVDGSAGQKRSGPKVVRLGQGQKRSGPKNGLGQKRSGTKAVWAKSGDCPEKHGLCQFRVWG